MLRGVWGAALRAIDVQLYEQIFVGRGGGRTAPLDIVRPASPDPADAPAVDWIRMGDATAAGPSLL